MSQPDATFDQLLETLKRASGVLREADVDFVLGGGVAIWARGGPETEHDLDFFVRPEDAERALQVLSEAGFRPEKPPEGWLYKAWDDDVLVTKLLALKEHSLDYDSLLETARAVREQIDWDEVRRRTEESPYAKAFLTLVDELEVSSAREQETARSRRGRRPTRPPSSPRSRG